MKVDVCADQHCRTNGCRGECNQGAVRAGQRCASIALRTSVFGPTHAARSSWLRAEDGRHTVQTTMMQNHLNPWEYHHAGVLLCAKLQLSQLIFLCHQNTQHPSPADWKTHRVLETVSEARAAARSMVGRSPSWRRTRWCPW